MSAGKKRIYLSPPHMSGREMSYVEDAFASNWIAPLGPHVDGFEAELADSLGVKGAAALISGTAAIHLALQLTGVKRGDVVFCSALTFAATSNPVLYLGAEPVFIDAEPETWNMSPSALERALVEAEEEGCLPKAVIVVNLYGQSADMDPLLELCEHYDVTLLEDAAESLGATYRGKASGSFGHFGILSFNGNKIITTSGGGALVSDDIEALKRARYLASQARQPARHYEHTEVGYNYRMSNILAALGRVQLALLEERVAAKRAIFERYRAAFQDVQGFSFMPEATFGRSTRWLTALTVDPQLCGASRDQIIDTLEAENIEARPVWKPLQLQPLYSGARFYRHLCINGTVPLTHWESMEQLRWEQDNKKQEKEKKVIREWFVQDCEKSVSEEPSPCHSVSQQFFEQGLCLPSGSGLEEEDQQRVIKCIKKLL